MAMRAQCRAFAVVSVVLAVFTASSSSTSFTIINNCANTIWPGAITGDGKAGLDSTGFELAPGQSRTVSAPSGWSGRFWGRTFCYAADSGKFTCVTGDCGTGRVDCTGGGGVPPATWAEFTLNGNGGMDFYDVSLVDGFNLPMLVTPQGATTTAGGNCVPTGCEADLNAGACPADLRVSAPGGGVVACKSACEAFRSDQYCCKGMYEDPNTCFPSNYSQVFKSACPKAYSYAYDDKMSTFTCPGTATTYNITFCPGATSGREDGSKQQTGAAAARPPLRLVLLFVAILALARDFF
uniref:Thaumatin-like protein n=1 Tax=Leersia perrieri TaxID=77586 RepID=A0A0D9VFL3_9ORYZ